MESGVIKTLFTDVEKDEALFPRTKTRAVSNDNGVGLDALLDEMNHNISNKAPAGFGYGEAKYLIWWDDSDGTKLENALDSFFDDVNMRDKIYRFTVVDYPACDVAGQGGYADIVCTDFTGGTPQSITIVYYAVDSSARGMAIATKKKHSGVWYPWEYVNPPMFPGVEYRTTERWDGKVVYTKLINCQAMSTSGRMPVYIGNVGKMIRYAGHCGVGALPYRDPDSNGTIDMAVETDYVIFNVNVHEGKHPLLGTAYAQLWYIKD